MSSAEVLPPDVQLLQSTAKAFDPGAAFIYTKTINKDGNAVPESADKNDMAQEDYFVLSDTPFVDLQAYLVSALRLPENQAEYEILYPKDIFQARLKQHDATLYDRTRSVLINIYDHCRMFKKETFNTLISTAGSIVNFSETANQQSQIARETLPIITKAGARISDKDVQQALGDFVDAVNILRAAAGKAKGECNTQVKAIGAFKDLTVADKSKLQEVRDLNEKYLPSVQDINTENKTKISAAYDKLNTLCKAQNAKYDQLKPFVKYFANVPILGIWVIFKDLKREIDAVDGIRRATAEYETVFNSTNAEMKAALRFRAQSKHLMKAMDDVLATIAKAEKALNDMAGWFSKMETDLDAVDSVLEQSIGHASDNKFSFLRKRAEGDLDNAGQKWLKLVDLAGRFQARGMIASTDIDKKLKEESDPAEKNIDIVSTNYGGSDVTEFSRILFRYGESIRIRTIEPGFPDPWDRVPKTISLIHTYENEIRLYVCREFTNFHVLSPGPISSYRGSPRIAIALDLSKTRSSAAEIEVLAVVWGPEDVTFKQQTNERQSVLDYVYLCARQGSPVTFNSDKMGGDTWPGHQKSGVIFFRTAGGGKVIRQLTGREGSSVPWPHI